MTIATWTDEFKSLNGNMKATQLLHNLGQSIWLDNIPRDLLKQYIAELSVTGPTSNPTIFDRAIKNSTAYDAAIREKTKQGKSGDALFFELPLEDITRAADTFRPIHDKTNGMDGWTSLEVSPMLAHDTASMLAAQLQDEGAKSFVKSWNELMSASDALQKGN
jgi:transaldolase